MTMRVGLMVPTLDGHDGIRHDLLGMLAVLTAEGVEATVFTATGEADFPFPVMHYRDVELVLDGESDLLIYHACAADPAAAGVMACLPGRVVVRVHGTAPAALLSRWSSGLGRASREAREALFGLADGTADGFLADSAFGAAELAAFGIDPACIEIVPRLHRCDQLRGLPDDPPTARMLETRSFNVLAVGRLAPNEDLELMMQSLVNALNWGGLDIQLHHVGQHDPRLQDYTNAVVDILARNGALSRLTFYGHVGPRALATLYRHCDLFWTTSRYDGFNLPALEAMAFGRPVLTSRQPALAELCGDAGVYAETAEQFARHLHEILADDAFRLRLGRTSRQRYDASFLPSRLARRFTEALRTLGDRSEARVPASSLDRAGDWFGLPQVDDLLATVMPTLPAMPPYGLNGRERRRDVIDHAFRLEPAPPPLADYLASPDLLAYARDLEMPQAARHLGPALRLFWTFNRAARSRFDLQRSESVADYCAWFDREAAADYAPLLRALRPARGPAFGVAA